MLDELYRLTSDEVILEKRVGELLQVKEAYAEAHFVSRVAEACWKIAQTYSLLGQYKSASSWYGEAVNFFIQSSKKIPEARDYYSDLAQYMRAWSEIESARDSHLSGRCSKSKEHYEKLLDCLKNPKAGTI